MPIHLSVENELGNRVSKSQRQRFSTALLVVAVNLLFIQSFLLRLLKSYNGSAGLQVLCGVILCAAGMLYVKEGIRQINKKYRIWFVMTGIYCIILFIRGILYITIFDQPSILKLLLWWLPYTFFILAFIGANDETWVALNNTFTLLLEASQSY